MELTPENITNVSSAVISNCSTAMAEHEKCFKNLYKSNATKIAIIFISLLSTVLLLVLSYGVIWFERFGNDHKRTLMNKLVSSLCWFLMEWYLVGQTICLIRHFIGPLPPIICAFQQIQKTSVKFQLLLCFDAMQITRYIFIFHLKNPSAVKDDFWSVFITSWILGFSNLYSFKLFFVDGLKPLSYYTCIDTDQMISLNGYQRSYGIIEITTLLIHIVIQCRIVYHKRNNSMPNQLSVMSNSSFSSNTISSFTTRIFSIIGLCAYTLITFKVNSMHLSEVEVYPNYIYVQIYNLILSNIVGFMLTAVYYVTHPQMTRCLLQNIRDR